MYEQDTDARLLTSLLHRLECKILIDAGAERGAFTQAFLDHGAERVFAVEPFPPNAGALQSRFAGEPRVKVLEMALSEKDEVAMLHVIQDRDASNVSSYHSLARAAESELLQTVGELPVSCRSLGSLVDEGVIPPNVGILKIDAEGHDFAILRGMGQLFSAAAMVEFWDDLPDGVGRRLFALADVNTYMKARGYAHCVVVKRHDEFETIELDDDRTRPGDWGNAIFLHESMFPRMPDFIAQAAAAAHLKLIDQAVFYKTECAKRLEVIEEQGRALQAIQAALPIVPDNPAPIAD